MERCIYGGGELVPRDQEVQKPLWNGASIEGFCFSVVPYRVPEGVLKRLPRGGL